MYRVLITSFSCPENRKWMTEENYLANVPFLNANTGFPTKMYSDAMKKNSRRNTTITQTPLTPCLWKWKWIIKVHMVIKRFWGGPLNINWFSHQKSYGYSLISKSYLCSLESPAIWNLSLIFIWENNNDL